MKKNLLSFLLLSAFLFSGAVFAEMFDNLRNITPIQKQQLSNTYFEYKQRNNDLENKLSQYQSKLNQLQDEKDKTPTDISLLRSAYERNISVLKSQQAQLKKETDEKYKSIMTLEQYQEYQAQQLQTDNAFQNFLRK